MVVPVSVAIAGAEGSTALSFAEGAGDSTAAAPVPDPAAGVPESAAGRAVSEATLDSCEVAEGATGAEVFTEGTTGLVAVLPVADPLPAAVPPMAPTLAALRAATFCALGLAGS